MKKENLLFLGVALIIGLLVGIIVGNKSGNSPSGSSSTAPPSAVAPVVNHEQNIKMLLNVVAQEPANRTAWVQLGNSYFDTNRYVESVEAYDKALELEGNDPNVLTDQGVMFRKLGWYDRAVQNFIKASQLNPMHTQSLFNLGLVYNEDLKDFPAAISAWEKLLQISPDGQLADQLRTQIGFMKAHPPGTVNQ